MPARHGLKTPVTWSCVVRPMRDVTALAVRHHHARRRFSWSSIDCLVIGAGVVGLAVARALARAGREVVVVEAENAIGTGTSSRNSEVIHAGIYYPTGLVKTRLCVEGKAMLYAFCRDYSVPHRRCGKLIVAADDERGRKACSPRSPGEGEWSRRSRLVDRRGGAHSRAGAQGGARPAFAVDGNHRQSCPYAGVAGRRGGAWRDGCARDAIRPRPRRRSRRGNRDRRRRADAARGHAGCQRRGARRTSDRRRDRRHAGRKNSAAPSRQG